MVIVDGVHERRHPGQVHGVHLRPVLEKVFQDLFIVSGMRSTTKTWNEKERANTITGDSGLTDTVYKDKDKDKAARITSSLETSSSG